jgi:hypothetical protein
MTRAARAGEGAKVAPLVRDDGARAAHDWPPCPNDECVAHQRTCVLCSRDYVLGACLLTERGTPRYGRDVCFACASKPQRPMVRTRHGDDCPCWVCVDMDRADQRSKYTGGVDE